MERLITRSEFEEFDIVNSGMSGNFDAWRSQVAMLFDCTPLNARGADEGGSAQSWRVNSMVFSAAQYSAMANERKSRHLLDTGQFVFLYRFLEGSNWLQVNGAVLRQAPGSLIFLDYAHTFSAVHTNARTQGIYIPHEMLGLRPGELNGFKQVRAGTPLAKLLIQELDSVFALLNSGRTTISRRRTEHLTACLRMALESDGSQLSQRAQHRESLSDLIRRFIESNLDSPDLNAELILKNFGVSRAGLYRMFEAYSGVRAYINERRLMRATLDLARGPNRRGQVSQAAERWGFSSDANFVRAMNTRFAASPGKLFNAPMLPAVPDRDVSALVQAKAMLPTVREDMQVI